MDKPVYQTPVAEIPSPQLVEYMLDRIKHGNVSDGDLLRLYNHVEAELQERKIVG
jgi:hypothetical protein